MISAGAGAVYLSKSGHPEYFVTRRRGLECGWASRLDLRTGMLCRVSENLPLFLNSRLPLGNFAGRE